MQPVITTRIYVLHKTTIALKFMSYINSDLQIPAKKLQTPGQPQCGSTAWRRVARQVLGIASNMMNVIEIAEKWKQKKNTKWAEKDKMFDNKNQKTET